MKVVIVDESEIDNVLQLHGEGIYRLEYENGNTKWKIIGERQWL